MEILIRVTLKQLCFGIVSKEGIIVDAAPVAHKSIGQKSEDVIKYWRGRGAYLERVTKKGITIS